jgi:hypothetical protein
MRVAVLAVAVTFAACQRPVPPAPTAPPPPPAPAGPPECNVDLSGEWVHAIDPSFRYRGVDDGGTLTLELVRAEAPRTPFHPRKFRKANPSGEDGGVDGGASDEAQAPTVRLVLTRSAHKFAGATEVAVHHPRGRDCVAVFPAEVVGCRDGGLTLVAASALSLDEACAPTGDQAPTSRQPLRRP